MVEHALKEWCHSLFGEDAEEKCAELNEIKSHDIDDGSHEDLKISDIYETIRKLRKLNDNYENRNVTPKDIYILKFKGYQLNLKKINIGQPTPPTINANKDIKIKKEGENFKIFVTISPTDKLDIREDGIYLETTGDIVKLSKQGDDYNLGLIKKIKQRLRNLDLTRLENDIEKSNEEIEI